MIQTWQTEEGPMSRVQILHSSRVPCPPWHGRTSYPRCSAAALLVQASEPGPQSLPPSLQGRVGRPVPPLCQAGAGHILRCGPQAFAANTQFPSSDDAEIHSHTWRLWKWFRLTIGHRSPQRCLGFVSRPFPWPPALPCTSVARREHMAW